MHRGKWEYQAVMATSRKDPQKLKIQRARGKRKLPRHPFCNPLSHSVHLVMLWDALASSSPGISLFSLQPAQSVDKGTLLTATKRFPIFIAQLKNSHREWGGGSSALPSAHHPLLPSRPRHTAGAEVQDHHRDDSRGAVGALLLPLRRLGDQLYPQGTAAACMASRGTPGHPKKH